MRRTVMMMAALGCATVLVGCGSPQAAPAPAAQPSALAAPTHIPGGKVGAAIRAGKRLFADPALGNGTLSCNSCHADYGTKAKKLSSGATAPSLIGAAATFPKVSVRSGQVVTLEEHIQSCIQNPLGGRHLAANDPKLVDLTAYVTWLSSGKPVSPGK